MKIAEVRVLCIPGMRAAMEALGPEFERTAIHTLVQIFGLPTQLKELIDRGDFDVALFASEEIDHLSTLHKIDPSTRMNVARMSIGVAARAGAPQPDISSVEAFRNALLQATSISYTKDSRGGIYLASLMERLGIAEEMRAKTKLMGRWRAKPACCCCG